MASIKLTGVISLISVIASGPGFAEQGTEAQREACTPDAFRLCMSAMPDSSRVENCLRAAGPRLSPGCYAVFNPPQDVQTTATVRERRAPREIPQREVQQRDRYDGSPRFDRPSGDARDYQQQRAPRDGFVGAPPNTFDDD